MQKLQNFPPELVVDLTPAGDDTSVSLRRFVLRYNQLLIRILSVISCLSFMIFTSGPYESALTLRILQIVVSVYYTFACFVQFYWMRKLYQNRRYHGKPFIVIDILAGPVALAIDFAAFAQSGPLPYVLISDVFTTLKIFTIDKIRILVLDIAHVLYIARDIAIAMSMNFYTLAYVGYALFAAVNPNKFSSISVSVLTMFQVTTFDSWNVQVQQPIIQAFGSLCCVYCIGLIFVLVYFYFNFFLSAFVSYYSKPEYRINYLYKYTDDEDLNPDLQQRIQFYTRLGDVVKHITASSYTRKGRLLAFVRANYKALFALAQVVVECLQLLPQPNRTVTAVHVIVEFAFSTCLTFEFVTEIVRARRQKLVIAIMFVAGPLALLHSIVSCVIFGDTEMSVGGAMRALSLLTTRECVYCMQKLVAILPNVYSLALLNLIVVYIFAFIGHSGLNAYDKDFGWYFSSITQTFLFLLQVITFDTWGDICRSVSMISPVWVIYFLIVVVVIGFFLMNLLVGQIATQVQPFSEELFQKYYLENKLVPNHQCNKLMIKFVTQSSNEKPASAFKVSAVDSFASQQASARKSARGGVIPDLDNSRQRARDLIEQFEAQDFSQPVEPLYVTLNGRRYEIKTSGRVMGKQ